MWDVSPVRWQTTQFSYNAQGLVAERRERIRLGSSTPWDLFTYTYNRAGMLTADRVTVGTHTLRHQYQYDRRGLLTTVGISHSTSGTFSQILALDYAIDGAVTERHLGTGSGQTTVPYAYDVAGRIHEIGDVDRFLNPDPFAARYSYAPSGLISQIETRSGAAAQQCPYGGAACSVRWHYAFSYDGLARLADALYDSVPSGGRGSAYRVHNITYDPQGNLLTLNRYAPTSSSPSGTIVDQLSYNYTPRTNRLASVADGVTTDLDWDAKPSTFQYNRVGSMTRMIETLSGSITRTTAVQRYDERQLPENLTITHAQGGTIISTQQVRYRYDVNGQRIHKEITGPGAHEERYVRDGMRLIGVFDESNTLQNWNIGGAAGLVGRADADPTVLEPVSRYYVTDHLGSIRAVVNQSGTVTEGRDYYPYGLTMPGRFYVLADTTREGFTGHELDPETGDYYAGARFYGSALARWFVVDPLADAYPAWSPYGYVLGDPVSLVDPDGREVRCRTEEECQRAANELNAVHENHDGDTNITVEATTWEETRGILWWKKTVTVEGFRLSTGNSEFDWSQDQYTFALYDVINSEEVVFNLEMVSPETPMPGMPANYLAGRVLGHNYAGPGGGRVIVATSNRLNEPVGVVLMHELVGHGHPVGGSGGRQAWDINRHYQRKIGYTLRDSRGISINHRGYLSEIGWTRIGLYNK